jgi:hypothetical protein
MNNLVIDGSLSAGLGYAPGSVQVSSSFFPPCSQIQCTFPSQVVALQAGQAILGPPQDVVRIASILSNSGARSPNEQASFCRGSI